MIMADTQSNSSKLLPFRRRDTDRTKGAASSTGPAMLEVLHTYEHDLQVCETYVKQLRTLTMLLLEAEAEVIARRDLRDMLAQTATDLGTLADRRDELSEWTDLLVRSTD